MQWACLSLHRGREAHLSGGLSGSSLFCPAVPGPPASDNHPDSPEGVSGCPDVHGPVETRHLGHSLILPNLCSLTGLLEGQDNVQTQFLQKMGGFHWARAALSSHTPASSLPGTRSGSCLRPEGHKHTESGKENIMRAASFEAENQTHKGGAV